MASWVYYLQIIFISGIGFTWYRNFKKQNDQFRREVQIQIMDQLVNLEQRLAALELQEQHDVKEIKEEIEGIREDLPSIQF